jgi:hypothetical protein
VAVEGLNPDGSVFVVTRIIGGVPAAAKTGGSEQRDDGEDATMVDAEGKEASGVLELRKSDDEVLGPLPSASLFLLAQLP